MNFKGWMQLESTIKSISASVLRSMKAVEGGVKFSFPSYVQLSTQINQYLAQPSMTLAAGYVHPGEPISEGATGEKQGGSKEVGAMKALQALKDPGWTPKQWQGFQQTIKKRTSDIGKSMGLLFEIEVLLHLMQKRKLIDVDEDENVSSKALFNKRRRYFITDIQNALFGKPQAEQILYMVQSHAAELAEQIYTQSAKMLKCKPDALKFTGGENANFLDAREDPADIIIYCKDSRIGWNLKFTSETKIHLMSIGPRSAYTLVGGNDIDQFNSDLEDMMKDATAYNHYDYFRSAIIELLGNEVKENINDPAAFTRLLNQLISGGQKTAIAPRNWGSPSMGGAKWSANIQKDFVVKGHKLLPQADADVTVVTNNTYVKITYKRPGGSFSGTSIFLEPKDDRVVIKVNNLTSDRR